MFMRIICVSIFLLNVYLGLGMVFSVEDLEWIEVLGYRGIGYRYVNS